MTARTELAKGAWEIEVFTAFASLARLPFDLSTVQKRSPPEPDLRCTTNDGFAVAFELVEICDPTMAESISTAREGGACYFRTADPTPAIILKKISRTYVTELPVGLLCYTAGRVVTPPLMIVSEIRVHLAESNHPFHEVWLFSRGQVHFVC